MKLSPVSAENNAAYTSAGFHPALAARLWAEAGLKPGQALLGGPVAPLVSATVFGSPATV